MSDLAIVANADTEYCFDCGRKAESPCEECAGLLPRWEALTASRHPLIQTVLHARPLQARGAVVGIPCPICSLRIEKASPVFNVILQIGLSATVHLSCVYEPPKSTEEGCRHEIYPASACTLCSGKEVSSVALSRAFPARKSGRCIVCSEGFAAGSYIAKFRVHGRFGWGHDLHR